VRWYINDASLRGQYADALQFEGVVRALLLTRSRIESLRGGLSTTRTLRERPVTQNLNVRETVQRAADPEYRRAVLSWLDRSGPFVEDDRAPEEDDYFEYAGLDITDSGLGEAARRVKASELATTFSFVGSNPSFELTPLAVEHGLPDDRLGIYNVENSWTVDQLRNSAIAAATPATSWKLLIETARQRFPRLILPDSIFNDGRLAREPFEAAIRDRVLSLLGHLDLYMSDRQPNGAEGPISQSVINNFFTGENALFTGESPSNQRDYRDVLTFPDPDGGDGIFAHWHGKIRHRFFRMHFEWPVPAGATYLKIVYLGPKLTK
jgi:hypothetical protein